MSEASDKPDKKEEAPAASQRIEREIPLDTRLLSEAVIELNISRKNVGIYPPGHIQIIKSIDRAFAILQKLFEIRDQMTLGVAKDTLLVGNDYLDEKNLVYRDFALSMNQQGIAAVTFIRGLDKEELVRFHRILTTKTDEIRSVGGIEKVMSDANIPHIKIVTVDYGSFHLTEEQEISSTSTRVGKKEPISGRILYPISLMEPLPLLMRASRLLRLNRLTRLSLRAFSMSANLTQIRRSKVTIRSSPHMCAGRQKKKS